LIRAGIDKSDSKQDGWSAAIPINDVRNSMMLVKNLRSGAMVLRYPSIITT